jgi:DNA-binding NtrC family response regulator
MERHLYLLSSDQTSVAVARRTLEPLGVAVTVKQRLPALLRAMQGPDLVLADVSDVARAMREIRSYHPEAVVLVTTREDCAKSAVQEGAHFCLVKPLNTHRLAAAVRSAHGYLALRDELEKRQDEAAVPVDLYGGTAMRKVLREVERLARRDVPVLISGERGTGREHMARVMHRMSSRRTRSFVTVEGAGGDLETALFGTEGSPGKAVSAEGGTLFLKNLDGLAPERARSVGAFMKERTLPGSSGSRLDVRVLCSLNGIQGDDPLRTSSCRVLRLPPLRERVEDIVPLAEQFLTECAQVFETGPKRLAQGARKYLTRHPWPGNVGELKNAIRKACLLSSDELVEERHFVLGDVAAHCSIKEFLQVKLGKYIGEMTKLRRAGLHATVMNEVEKSLIELVLEEASGNQLKSAATLGINRTTLRTKIKNYRISP